ncbi:MAG: hypothetical protein JWP67_2938 [Mucilaginibacter sp.]|jgi:hypothetical protein|nr:hypothetical protein [Mucilaginibacter sp.]
MKKEMIKMLALLFFGAAALSSCSVENRGRHRRHIKDRHNHSDREHDYLDDRDYYNNY